MSEKHKDSLYAEPQDYIGNFVFDDHVASVFDDMIRRSVPGYGSVVNMLGVLAGRYAQPHTACYDLGCSLGAGTLAMRRFVDQEQVRIIAVDNSEAMVSKCRQNIVRSNLTVPVEIICDDISRIDFEPASVVAINFTLQFISPEERQDLINKISHAIQPGGVLVISEKLAFADEEEERAQTELHHAFKKLNGYSELEIAQKRTALDHVLIADTVEVHRQRLEVAGFTRQHVWFRCFNFASMIAYK